MKIPKEAQIQVIWNDGDEDSKDEEMVLHVKLTSFLLRLIIVLNKTVDFNFKIALGHGIIHLNVKF